MNIPPDQSSNQLSNDLPTSDNRYKAPESVMLAKEYAQTNQYLNLLPMPRKCAAGAGMNWMIKAFALFKEQPLLWFGISVTFMVMIGIASSIPLLNILIIPVAFIFIAGIVRGAAMQSQGNELRFDVLFSAFKTHWQPLAIVGLLYLVGIILAMIPLFLVLGSMILSAMSGDLTAIADFSVGSFFLGYLISILLSIPVYMAIWFAPALIVLHNVSAIEAMKKSFRAGVTNLLPILIYGLVCIFLLPILILFTLGLGIFLIFPVILLTYYTSYRDVWTDQPLSAV